MAITAPLSKYKKNNVLIAVVVCIGLAAWLGYDGYMNKTFIEKHTMDEGTPDSTLAINRKAPFYLLGAAVLAGIYFVTIRNKKIVADGNELIINDKDRIPYDSIEKIDKTFFDSKGYFVISYKKNEHQESELRLSDRIYDNLPAVLDELVSKIS
ncbi:MAG: hypothetical protein ACYTBP_05545 [Planctomycetota bacterium]|jgi:hypothetical protein